MTNFLFSKGDLTAARKVLVIQSGSHELLAEAIALARRTSPQAAVSVLLRRGIGELPADLRGLPGLEYIENTGSRIEQVRDLRARGFDGAFVLYSNHPGYWKLKLLPFAIGAGAVLGINEHLGVFPVSLRHANRLGGHLLWRLGSKSTSSSGVLEDLAAGAAAPAMLAYLLAYERAAQLRARLRGSPARWKSLRKLK